MTERLKFKCNVCSAKCRLSIRLEEENQYPLSCLQDNAFEAEWEELRKKEGD
jgi:hypothetical protein